ncbi:dephospho-CoA kinase [Xylophilus sp. GW821-FHT01B05]
MRKLGLTGGIGSGKSTVAGLLAGHGAVVIDADALSRATTAPGGAAMPQIAQAFGADFIQADGALDRTRMRALAFSDASARQRLEAIVHPLVRQATENLTAEAARAGARWVVHDVPLLVESRRWAGQVDRVLVVDCRPETQIARVMARSGMTEEAVRQVIAAQASRPERLRAADIVVYNDDCTLAELAVTLGLMAANLGL